MFQTYTGVVTLADGAEVINEWFDRWVILVIDVLHSFLAEGAFLFSRISTATFLLFRHR